MRSAASLSSLVLALPLLPALVIAAIAAFESLRIRSLFPLHSHTGIGDSCNRSRIILEYWIASDDLETLRHLWGSAGCNFLSLSLNPSIVHNRTPT